MEAEDPSSLAGDRCWHPLKELFFHAFPGFLLHIYVSRCLPINISIADQSYEMVCKSTKKVLFCIYEFWMIFSGKPHLTIIVRSNGNGQIPTPDKVFGATNIVEWGIPENTIQIAVQPLQTKYNFGAISSLQLQCKP